MKLNGPASDYLVPDGTGLDDALARTTRLGTGAHPDDLEIMAIPGILDCHGKEDGWFTGVVICDGAGSPRSGAYAGLSDADLGGSDCARILRGLCTHERGVRSRVS